MVSKLVFTLGLLFSLFLVNVSAHHSYGHGLQRPEVYPGPAHAEPYQQLRPKAYYVQECRIYVMRGTDYYGRRWKQLTDSCGKRTQGPRFDY